MEMSLEEIQAIEKEIEKEIDDLWEIQRVLRSVKTLIEFFTGVKEHAFETGNK